MNEEKKCPKKRTIQFFFSSKSIGLENADTFVNDT